jgi:predicted transcriptional regulator of viral defense system
MHFMHTQCMKSVAVTTDSGCSSGEAAAGNTGPNRKVALRQALEAAAQIAANQFGAITRRQLIECGLAERQTERRVAEGRLKAVARGVYVISGTAATWERQVVSAYLFTSTRANPGVVSHETAGAIYGLANCDRTHSVVLTAGSADRHPNPLATMCRINDLLAEDVVVGPLGIPMTSPARTVLDLAASSTRLSVIEAVIADAVDAGVVTLDELQERFAKASHRAGIVRVRQALGRVVRLERRRQRDQERVAEMRARRAARRMEREQNPARRDEQAA